MAGASPLLTQGLEKLYSKREQWQPLARVYTQLANNAAEAGDAVKCGNALSKIVSIQREHGQPLDLAEALMAFVPGSKYFGVLETLPVPDQSAPASNPAFNAQMLMHAAALDNALELVELFQDQDSNAIEEKVKKQKTTLEGAKLGIPLLRDQATAEVLKRSRVPMLLELVRNHPRTDDAQRRSAEVQLLQHFYRLTFAVPLRGPTADPELKRAVRQQTYEFARGFVLLQVPDELAWSVYLDWSDAALPELPYTHLVDYVRLFPQSPRACSIRALLCLVDDEAYKRGEGGEVTRKRISQETDLLQLALDGLDKNADSLLVQRIVALFYLLDKDYAAAAEVLVAAHKRLEELAHATGAEYTRTEVELNAQLATAYTHLHPPQHHAEALALAQAALASAGTNLDARMAQAYLSKARGVWFEAKRGFEIVMALADSEDEALSDAPQASGRNLAALRLSPDAHLEAEAELAWCQVQQGDLDAARARLEALLATHDHEEQVFGPEFRARLWWQLGRCFWAMGGEYRHEAAYAYRCYVTAIKRCGSFAPAFTALGEYYETEVSPPDVVRASKCFQKAFEMDATEYGAARRLVEHFANQREWSLVEVIARRVVEAEGGVDALAGRPKAGVHVSPNAWVWKAIGIVEALQGRPERAIVALQVVLRSNARDADAWVRMGEAYLAFGRPIPALKTFARALALLDTEHHADVAAWHVHYGVAEAQRRLGRFDRALPLLERVAAERPEQHGVRALLAQTRLDEARRLLASGYARRAHRALIAAVYDAAHTLHGDALLTLAWKVVGDACFLLSKLEVARAGPDEPAPVPHGATDGLRSVLYELALLLDQHDVDTRLTAISAVRVAELTAEVPAADDLRELSAAEYASYAALCYKYVAAAHMGESKTVVFAWADLAMGLARLATALRVDEDAERRELAHEQAVQCVRVALSIRPQTRLWLLLGNLYFGVDAGTAQHAYIMAIESSAKSPAPWTNLGFLYLREGDAELAEQAFVRAQTIAPDWPASWLGRALILVAHSRDLRARLSLFEHAYMLSEGTSLEADYGFALAAFVRLAHGPPAAPARVLAPLLALNHYVARRPLDDAPLHLSALLAEQLGAGRLAIARIERATEELEAEFEATESPALALQYGLASMNLGRIRLGRGDADGAVEAFEGALALLGDDDDAGADEALPVRAEQLVHARLTASAGIAHAHFLRGAHAEGIAQLEAVRDAVTAAGLAHDTEAALTAELAVRLARMHWARGEVPPIARELDAALARVPSDPLLITTRAAAAAAAGDTAQYNQVLAQYAAALPEAQRVQLRNMESTAQLSIWQLAAVVRRTTHAVPDRCAPPAPHQHARGRKHARARARARRRDARPPRGGARAPRRAAAAPRAPCGRRLGARRGACSACGRAGAPRPQRALERRARDARPRRAPDAPGRRRARRGRRGCRGRRGLRGYRGPRERAARTDARHRRAPRRGRRAPCAVAHDGAPRARRGVGLVSYRRSTMRTTPLLGAGALAAGAAYAVGAAMRPAAEWVCARVPHACTSAAGARVWHAGTPLRRAAHVVHAVDRAFPALVVAGVLAVVGYVVAYMAIEWSRAAFLAQGLAGVDLLKAARAPHGSTPSRIPESLGLPCAAVYLFLVLLFIPFRYFGPHAHGASAAGVHQDLATLLSALLSMYSGALLGFVDDVLDIRWRYKLPIPLLSSIPMLVVYVASGGSTSVVVPAWPPVVRAVLRSTSLELGAAYYAYMMLLATFCTNCINILAGINGVEVGQALVIAASVCVNDLLYLDVRAVVRDALRMPDAPVAAPAPSDVVARHLFSLHLLLPFVGTSLALLAWNRYPARVFVGDTYCYFAGMVLVAAGILGHYSKTLLLFFLPQIFNFVLSCPQLFKLVPCPRHRVPAVDRATGRLVPSCVRLAAHRSRAKQCATRVVLAVLQRTGVVAPVVDTRGQQVGVTNLTLLNTVLVVRGARPAPVDAALAEKVPPPGADPALPVTGVPGTLSITERGLWYYVMGIQLAGSLLAFGIRYWLAAVVFPVMH